MEMMSHHERRIKYALYSFYRRITRIARGKITHIANSEKSIVIYAEPEWEPHKVLFCYIPLFLADSLFSNETHRLIVVVSFANGINSPVDAL